MHCVLKSCACNNGLPYILTKITAATLSAPVFVTFSYTSYSFAETGNLCFLICRNWQSFVPITEPVPAKILLFSRFHWQSMVPILTNFRTIDKRRIHLGTSKAFNDNWRHSSSITQHAFFQKTHNCYGPIHLFKAPFQNKCCCPFQYIARN